MRASRRSHTVARAAPAFALLLVLFAASGCYPPKALPTYEYVTHYDRMTGDYEPLTSLAYVAEGVDLGERRALIVGPFRLGEEWVESEDWAVGYATMLRILLQRELSKLHQFELVTLEWDSSRHGPLGPGVLRMEGMVTRFHMGSGVLRYIAAMIPFYQPGATDLQVAGRLTEAGSGETLVEFVDRRRGIYNTPFGPNPKNLRKSFAMSRTTLDTARCVAAFIGHLCADESPAKVAALDEPDR